MRLFYNLLFPLAFLALLPGYLLRMIRRGNFRRDFGQRFARYAPELRGRLAAGGWIWVHAVSVGELLIALKVINELHRRDPSRCFVVSSTTSTAHALALGRREDWWVPVYTPVDFPAVVRRAFDLARPSCLVLTESEMWPNFIWTAADRGIPVVLVNARVSPRSERRYRKFAAFLRPVVRHLAAVGLQEPEHAELWRKLGLSAPRLRVTGSVKFDPAGPAAPARDFRPVLRACGVGDDDPVLLAGSTHEGEELILAEALRRLRPEFPRARLLIAPRHVERCAAVEAALQSTGFHVVRRSAAPEAAAADVVLIDTTGELQDWYACASAVFIGKSLCGRGGQNPVEAILAGCPVLFGPHMENFASLAAHLLDDGGAREVRDADSLAAAVRDLWLAPKAAEAMRDAATTALDAHRGATARTADLVEQALGGSDFAPPRV